MTWGGPTGDHDEITRVLPAEREGEPPAEGDDIVVVRRGSPPRSTVVRIVVAVLVAIVVLAAAVAVVALTDDDDSTNAVDASAPTPTSAPVTETTVSPAPTGAPATVPVSTPAPPTAPVAPPTTRAVPPPTAAAFVAPEISLDPVTATVTAGTPVVVTLRVHNGGREAASVPYDNDGCDPALVPSPDIACTLATRQLQVEPGADATLPITISTDNATPGDYDVAIGDRTVRVTIV